jgi:hypothetical protein
VRDRQHELDRCANQARVHAWAGSERGIPAAPGAHSRVCLFADGCGSRKLALHESSNRGLLVVEERHEGHVVIMAQAKCQRVAALAANF